MISFLHKVNQLVQEEKMLKREKERRGENFNIFEVMHAQRDEVYTPIRDKIAISCMLREIHEFSSHAIRHGLYIKNRKRLFCP